LDIPYFVYFRILRSDDERGLTTDKKKPDQHVHNLPSLTAIINSIP